MSVVAFAPNWLGDAVMALPALGDVRRHVGQDRLLVAARASVASLFELVPGVDGIVPLGPGGGLVRTARVIREDAQAVRDAGGATAILFPNSLRVALTAVLAGVRERWGYSRDLRRVLLTRGISRPSRSMHQVDEYRYLVAALGIDNGPREPLLTLAQPRIDDARTWLEHLGWDGRRPLVGVAPGAAFGGAKRWPPDRVAEVVATLAGGRGATCVIVGSAADADTATRVMTDAGRMCGADLAGLVINTVGRTSLGQLAGILAACTVFVSNDSGAMHLAAAVGTPIVAMFGPTDERATAPVARPGVSATVLAGTAWCRPCGFRECPLDHRCMRSIAAGRVLDAVRERL